MEHSRLFVRRASYDFPVMTRGMVLNRNLGPSHIVDCDPALPVPAALPTRQVADQLIAVTIMAAGMQAVLPRHALLLSHPTRPRLHCTRQSHQAVECRSAGSRVVNLAGTCVLRNGLRSAKRMRMTSADALSGDLVDPIPDDDSEADTDLVRRDVDLPNLDRVRTGANALCR